MTIAPILTLLAAGLSCGMAQAECADIVTRMHLTGPDHVSSTGTPISEAGGILQQNLFNVQSGAHRDSFEIADANFPTRDARAAFAKAARRDLNDAQKRRIEDKAQDSIITIGSNGCIDFDTRRAAYGITHVVFSRITADGYAMPFMPAVDDRSMWAAQNAEILSAHFHTKVEADDFRIAYLVGPEARLLMLDSPHFCGTLGCSAILLDVQDRRVWEGEMVEEGAVVTVADNGNILTLHDATGAPIQISMPR